MKNENNTWQISGNIVDVFRQTIYAGTVYINDGTIVSVEENSPSPIDAPYLLPGFIDAHVHIESAMLTPCQFARLAVVHGTVATVSDPHEIGNVLGVAGVRYMVDNGDQVPFKFYFGAPSCVPATPFETAGASITAQEIEALFANPKIKYLAEMMNWPGVLQDDPDVLAKIAIARQYNRPVDGHAPGLRGAQAAQYAQAGMRTDHECFTAEEALDKLRSGMYILIREGSAAKNFDALVDLLHGHWMKMMFCSDDKHPDSLVEGHINDLVKRAIARGVDLYKVLQAACINPVLHYQLEVGLLRPNDPADFVMVDNLSDFNVLQTCINGQVVARDGKTRIPSLPSIIVNNFQALPKKADDFAVKATGRSLRVMEAIDGQLITLESVVEPTVADGYVVTDVERDILKIAVVNRYTDAPPAVAFIRNVGLKSGAIASSVAHDSHNIIAVGVSDESICRAVNLLVESKGGIAAVDNSTDSVLPLPVAGLMSDRDGYEVARQYESIDRKAKSMGSTLQAPFMTLSFMALLVIPALKLSDQGLFNGESFTFVPVMKE